MLSLEAAIDWYTTVQPTISDIWRSEWFSIAMGLATVLCDCAVVGVQPTPVRVLDLPENLEPAVPVLPSMGALIELWIEALDRGWWYALAPNKLVVAATPLGLADRRRSVLGY
jgi:hypothetical protein